MGVNGDGLSTFFKEHSLHILLFRHRKATRCLSQASGILANLCERQQD